MEGLLQCGVCFETFNECCHRPLALPCGHTFCATCIRKGCLVHCPEDRSFFGWQKLPTNIAVLRAAVQCAQDNSCSASCSGADCMQHQHFTENRNTGAAGSGTTIEVTNHDSSSNSRSRRSSGRRARCRRWLKHLKLSAQRADSSAPPLEALAAAISYSESQGADVSVQQPTRLELLLQSPTPHHQSRQLRVQPGYSSTPPLITAHRTLSPSQQLPQPAQQQRQRGQEQQQQEQLVPQLPVVWVSLRGYLSALATVAVITHTIIRAAARSVMEVPERNLAQLILSILSFFPLFFVCTVYTCCTGLLAVLGLQA